MIVLLRTHPQETSPMTTCYFLVMFGGEYLSEDKIEKILAFRWSTSRKN